MDRIKVCRQAAVLFVALGGCGYPEATREASEPDYDTFASDVYPVLLRDCGSPACHGTHERFFQVFGPGRARLSADSKPHDPSTAQERALTYTRTRSMLIDPKGVEHSPLLRKPLARAAGGPEHGGDDAWGRGVYASGDDPGYLAIRSWALAMTHSLSE
ncbi:MAG: hypothetical protein RLZZ450_4688 [Pseudomonadota bacterium]|jgi:hypothetical protein